jgi:hypothetical protein
MATITLYESVMQPEIVAYTWAVCFYNVAKG